MEPFRDIRLPRTVAWSSYKGMFKQSLAGTGPSVDPSSPDPKRHDSEAGGSGCWSGPRMARPVICDTLTTKNSQSTRSRYRRPRGTRLPSFTNCSKQIASRMLSPAPLPHVLQPPWAAWRYVRIVRRVRRLVNTPDKKGGRSTFSLLDEGSLAGRPKDTERGKPDLGSLPGDLESQGHLPDQLSRLRRPGRRWPTLSLEGGGHL